MNVEKINWKTFLLVFIASLIYIIIILTISSINIETYDNDILESDNKVFGPITSNNVLKQEIKLNKEQKINYIKVFLATYARTNNNTNLFEIYRNDQLLYSIEVRSEMLIDNNAYIFKNLDINYNTNDKFYLVISSDDATDGNAITTWIEPDINNGKLYSYNNNNGEYVIIDGEVRLMIGKKENILEYITNTNINVPIIILLFITESIITIYILAAYLDIDKKVFKKV
jgi:hypothetical protein